MKQLKTAPPPNSTRYDWATLSSGDWYELTLGVDIMSSIEACRTNACFWARTNGYNIKTRKTSETTLALQLTKKPEGRKKKSENSRKP